MLRSMKGVKVREDPDAQCREIMNLMKGKAEIKVKQAGVKNTGNPIKVQRQQAREKLAKAWKPGQYQRSELNMSTRTIYRINSTLEERAKKKSKTYTRYSD